MPISEEAQGVYYVSFVHSNQAIKKIFLPEDPVLRGTWEVLPSETTAVLRVPAAVHCTTE